jgi:hypothetical protein
LASELSAELDLPKKTPLDVANKVGSIAPIDSRATSAPSESSS